MKPYSGWSVYCTTKAALDMLTKTIAVEQEGKNSNLKCMAIYPGVVDTAMQKQIRKTPKKDFNDVERFISLKKNKELFTPNEVADKIVTLITEDKLPNGAIYDLRDAKF
nr:SDR family NAD(P)-dependent oxidoreductase [Tenacibaculum sp. SG-28]